MEPVRTGIVLERCAASVPAARAFIRQALCAWGRATATVDDAALLVTELVDNAVRHASGTRIAVHLTCDDVRVCCLVLDEDPPWPRAQVSPSAPRAAAGALWPAVESSNLDSALAENGRGLHLVETIASRWGSYPDTRTGWSRKAVWFELLSPEQPTRTTPLRLHRVTADHPLPVRPPPK